jgi:hypothetical protein
MARMSDWLTGDPGTRIQTVCAVLALIVAAGGFTLRDFWQPRATSLTTGPPPEPATVAEPTTEAETAAAEAEAAAAEADVIRTLEASFPPGLHLFDYRPGQVLEIRNFNPTPRVWDVRNLPMLFFLVMMAGACSASAEVAVFIIPFVLLFWAGRVRRGDVVKINIRSGTGSYFKPLALGEAGAGRQTLAQQPPLTKSRDSGPPTCFSAVS